MYYLNFMVLYNIFRILFWKKLARFHWVLFELSSLFVMFHMQNFLKKLSKLSNRKKIHSENEKEVVLAKGRSTSLTTTYWLSFCVVRCDCYISTNFCLAWFFYFFRLQIWRAWKSLVGNILYYFQLKCYV